MANKTAVLRIESIIGRKDGMAEMFGEQPNFSATDLSKFLAENKAAKDLEIIIRTDGGNVDEALDMVDQLKEWKAQNKTITTKGYRVNSAGTLLFNEGTERLVSDNVQFTIHNARIPNIEGAPKEVLRAIADELEVYDNKILEAYSDSLNLTPSIKEEVRSLMKSETDLGAELAIKLGFATGRIVESTAKVGYTWTNKIAALVNKSNTNNDMSKEVKEIQAEVSGLKTWIKGIAKKAGLLVEAVAQTFDCADGSKLYSDAELAEGVEVFTDEAKAEKANGDFVLADGRTVTVVDGIVTAILEAPAAKKDDKDAAIAKLEKELADLKGTNEELVKADVENKKVIKEIVAKVEAFSTGKGLTELLSQEDGKTKVPPTPVAKHTSLRKRF